MKKWRFPKNCSLPKKGEGYTTYQQKAENGEIYIAGCLITEDDPDYYCINCNIKMHEDGRIVKVSEDENGYFGDRGERKSD